MLFITHALPKNLLVDEIVRIGAHAVTMASVPNDGETDSINDNKDAKGEL
jgi:hypothetical protein